MNDQITIEWHLDSWEWWGVDSRELYLDVEDFDGLSDDQIRIIIANRVQDEAESFMHLVYDEAAAVQGIRAALNKEPK